MSQLNLLNILYHRRQFFTLQPIPSWISYEIPPATISAINKLRSSSLTSFWHDIIVATFESMYNYNLAQLYIQINNLCQPLIDVLFGYKKLYNWGRHHGKIQLATYNQSMINIAIAIQLTNLSPAQALSDQGSPSQQPS